MGSYYHPLARTRHAQLCVLPPEVNAKYRLMVIAGVFSLLAGLILFRLYSLQNEEHLVWLKRAGSQHRTSVTIQGVRGNIVDTEGRTLAVSVPSVSIGVNPSRAKDKEGLSQLLAEVTSESKRELDTLLTKRDRFTWVARGLPLRLGEQLASVEDPGLNVIREFSRYYPQGALAGHILGRISRDGVGQAGIELTFNEKLAAASQRMAARRDAKGRLVMVSSRGESVVDEPAYRDEGGDIQLSIDSVVQNIVEEEFAKGLSDSQAKRIFGVVMDAENGEILAMVQAPEFNPNKRKARPSEFRNIALQNLFEPGSTLKPLVAAEALEKNIIRGNHAIDCENGRYRIGRKLVTDVHRIGVVSFAEAVAQSSNVCLAKVGVKLGASRLHGMLSRLEFGEKTGVELNGEARGILRDVDSWRPIDVVTHSFGHGVAVSALQLVRAYGAFANDGLLVTPTILKRKAYADLSPKRVFKQSVVREVNTMLKMVTSSEDGTGKKAAISGVTVYGKTGTAHKLKPEGGYDPERVIGSFIGFVKGEELGISKNLVMLVVVDEPGVTPRWGGVVAAPVFRRSMERIVTHYLRYMPKEKVTPSKSLPLATALLDAETLDSNDSKRRENDSSV